MAQNQGIFPALPPGWEARWDPNQNAYFYINHSNKTTSWEDPRIAHRQKMATAYTGHGGSQLGEGIPMQELSRPQPRSPHRSPAQPRQETAFVNQREAIVTRLRAQFPDAGAFVRDILVGCGEQEHEAVRQLKALGFKSEERPRPITPSPAHAATSPKRKTTTTTTTTPKRASPAKPSLSHAQKLQVKNKMKAEFRSLEDEVIQMALDACHYDEVKVKATLGRVTSQWESSGESRSTSAASSASSRPSSATRPGSATQRLFPAKVSVAPATIGEQADMEPVAFGISPDERLPTSGSRPSRTSPAPKVTSGSGVSSGQQRRQQDRAQQVTRMSQHLLSTSSHLLKLLATSSPCCPDNQPLSPRLSANPKLPSPQPSPGSGRAGVASSTDGRRRVVTNQPPAHQQRTVAARPGPAAVPHARVGGGGGGLAQGADRCLLAGPDPRLQAGADRSLLAADCVSADGPDPENMAGSDPGLWQGGQRHLAAGSGGAEGANPALRCGAHLPPLDMGRRYGATHV